MLNKKNILILIILIIVFLIFTVFNLIEDIKVARFAEWMIISLKINEDEKSNLDKIKIYRISPTNNKTEISNTLVNDNTKIWNLYKGYVKKVIIESDKNVFENIQFINIKIGTELYKISKKDIKLENDHEFIIDQKIIKKQNSLISRFNSIINWGGDVKLAVYNMFKGLILSFFILLLILFYKKFNTEYFWILIIFIFLTGIILRFCFTQIPNVTKDSWGFYGSAVKYYINGFFKSVNGRNLPYPAFIFLILAVFKDFSFITVFQHLLGLITGIIIFFIWKKFYVFAEKIDVNKKVYEIIGFILLFLYITNMDRISFEHLLMIEAVFSFFLSIQILIFIIIVENIYKNKFKFSYIHMTLFFINNYFIYLLQPRWGLAVVLCFFIYIVFIIITKIKIYKKAVFFIAVPVLLLILLLYIPSKIFSYNSRSSNMAPGYFLYWHFDFIKPIIEKDINNPNTEENKKELLKNQIIQYELVKLEKDKGAYERYKFNPNRMLYGKAYKDIKKYFNNDVKKYKKFCYSYFFRGLKKYPHKYIYKILGQLRYVYGFNAEVFSENQYRSKYYHYERNPEYNSYYPFLIFDNNLRILKKTECSLDYKLTIPFIYSFFNIIFMFIMILFLICFGFNVFKYFKNKLNLEYVIIGIIILIIFLIGFSINITVSMIHSLVVNRYIKDQFVIHLLFLFLSSLYLFAFAIDKENFIRKSFNRLLKRNN